MKNRRSVGNIQPQKRAFDERERLAVFLGAGASKPFGYPLTGEMLPQLVQGLGDDTLTRWGYKRQEVRLLQRGLEELLPGVKQCKRSDLPLITDIFTLIDHSMSTGTALLGGWSGDEVRCFRGLVEQVIADMVTPDGGDTTRTLKQFARALHHVGVKCRLGVITTNYDIEIELALYEKYGNDSVAGLIDFGMSWREPSDEVDRIYARPDGAKLSFYKLHGSLNWLRCPLCEYIYINVYGSVVHHAWVAEKTDFNTCHCGHWPLQSVLVTPSYVRDTREVNLVGVWRSALDFLAAADKWVIAGYSLPPEDIAIRALLLKAYRIRQRAADKAKLQIWVVQGPGETERQRYKLMMPDAKYFDTGLEAFDLADVVG